MTFRLAFLFVAVFAAGAGNALPVDLLSARLDAIVASDLRVAQIGYRLNAANSDLCGDHRINHGIVVHARDQFPAAVRHRAATHYGLADRPAIAALVPDSPAERAGLRPGDQLLAIDAHPVPTVVADDKATYRTVATVLDMIDTAALGSSSVSLDVRRASGPVTIALPVTSGCAVRVQLVPSRDLNAFADDRYATITTALESFAADDDVLALFIGHELAHAYLHHEERLDRASPLHGLLGRAALPDAVVRQSEREADRLGMTLAANAGFDVSQAAEAWSRLAEAEPGSSLATTHPSTAERVAAARQFARELSTRSPHPAAP